MLARTFLYLHLFETLTAVRYTAFKQTCIHKQIARMQNTRELEVEKEQSIAHNTNMIYALQKYMKKVTKILRTRRLIRLPPERCDLKRPW